jgi:hypothetical protein
MMTAFKSPLILGGRKDKSSNIYNDAVDAGKEKSLPASLVNFNSGVLGYFAHRHGFWKQGSW